MNKSTQSKPVMRIRADSGKQAGIEEIGKSKLRKAILNLFKVIVSHLIVVRYSTSNFGCLYDVVVFTPVQNVGLSISIVYEC